MSASSVYCPVSRRRITRITNLGGGIVRLSCPEYDELTGLCELKRDLQEFYKSVQGPDAKDDDSTAKGDIFCGWA